jgi:putative phosphoribosyl transferase
MAHVSHRDVTVSPRMFADRREAGRFLGRALIEHAGTDAIVLGLPRGGVPVAAEVARVLDASLDVWVVRKLGVPTQPELGMGAIAEGPAAVLDRTIMEVCNISQSVLVDIAHREMDEVHRRVERYRGARPVPDLHGHTVILVDDGIATGSSMSAAIRAVKKQHPSRLVVAAPVATPSTIESLHEDVEEVVCLHTPEDLYAIGLWYEDFRQVPDAQVVRLLEEARRWRAARPS